MGTLYRNKVGGTLKQILTEIGEAPREERVSLLEEIDLSRMLVVKALEVYDLANVDPVLLPEGVRPPTAELKIAAAAQVSRAMDQVQRIVSAYAKAEALAPDRLTAQQLNHFASQVEMILRRMFGDDPRGLDAIEEIQKIRLPDVTQPIVTINID